MYIEDIKYYSQQLSRDMKIRIYGHQGQPILMFPCQDGDSYNYESFGFMDSIGDYIDNGLIQVFVVDTVDTESWSATEADKASRAWRQEAYYNFIVEEVVPGIREYNSSGRQPITFGCSLGATHAAICFLRRPDLFAGVLALSGVYDAKYFYEGWMNEISYQSSPVHFLADLPQDHPYINLYNQSKIIFCVGQGAWEDEGRRTTAILRDEFQAKGINAWVDFWGFDVFHDWPWWKRQIRYFLPHLL